MKYHIKCTYKNGESENFVAVNKELLSRIMFEFLGIDEHNDNLAKYEISPVEEETARKFLDQIDKKQKGSEENKIMANFLIPIIYASDGKTAISYRFVEMKIDKRSSFYRTFKDHIYPTSKILRAMNHAHFNGERITFKNLAHARHFTNILKEEN